MKPEQEDALVEEVGRKVGAIWDIEPIRLAIRAAVAAERERCAKVCEELLRVEPHCHNCAAAIRGG